MTHRRTLSAALVLGAGLLGLGACAPQPVGVISAPVQVPARGCDTRFVVANGSSLPVRELYFSHSSLSGWGADQLGTQMLPPGRSVSYTAANVGNYDFRVVWTNGRVAELRNVNVCVVSRISVTNSGLYAN